MNDFQFVVVWSWLGSIVAGAAAGQRRGEAFLGALLGLLFGPVGVIGALGLDGRARCSHCAGRLDGIGEVCQHCGAMRVIKEDSRKSKIPAAPIPPSSAPPARPKPTPRQTALVKPESLGGWG